MLPLIHGHCCCTGPPYNILLTSKNGRVVICLGFPSPHSTTLLQWPGSFFFYFYFFFFRSPWLFLLVGLLRLPTRVRTAESILCSSAVREVGGQYVPIGALF